MTKYSHDTRVAIIRIYNLEAQQRALNAFFEITTARWSLDFEDTQVLLGLDTYGAPNELSSQPLPPHAQLVLHEYEKIANTYRLMTHPNCYDYCWLMRPSHSLKGQAPIDLILTDGLIGVRKIATLLTKAAVQQSITDINPTKNYKGKSNGRIRTTD